MKRDCPDCQEYIRHIEDCPLFERFYISDCDKARQYWIGRLITANIPPKYYHLNLSKENLSSFPSTMRNLFLVDYKRVHHLLFLGEKNKKTHRIPIVILQEYLHKGTGFFYRGDMFGEQFKRLLCSPFELNTFIERMQKTDLLIVDRIEDVEDWAFGRVNSILKYRTDNLKSTIITSRLELHVFKKRYETLYSDIMENGEVFDGWKNVKE